MNLKILEEMYGDESEAYIGKIVKLGITNLKGRECILVMKE
jgi:hypothetical protein